MTKEYAITGMFCGSCVAKVSGALKGLKGVEKVDVQLTYPQARITITEDFDMQKVNIALKKVGEYEIAEKEINKELSPLPEIKRLNGLPEKSVTTYKPLILIVAFISGVSLLAQYPFTAFLGTLWMRHFMAGFFIVFAFFKLLNLQGFANSYRMYDIVAAKWKAWGYIYPFAELTLGVLYLVNLFPFETNLATAFILGISSIGVIKSNLDKKKIKCACLGDVFNLPMSTVTIVEDLTMVAMAIAMLLFNN